MRRMMPIGLALAIAALGLAANAAPRKLLLNVQPAPLAWADGKLAEKLETSLSRNSELQVVRCETEEHSFVKTRPPFPENRTDLESLLDWGTEVGGRYLLVVTVEKEGMVKRKSFNLPLIFHKYENVGVIEGEYRFLDLQKRRLLKAKPFKTEVTGARQYQAEMDDNSSDPTLHVTATGKSRLFDALEEKLTEHLVEQVAHLTRGR